MMEITRIAFSKEDIESVKERALEDLKERMWREVWRDNIELPQVKIKIEEEGNRFKVIAKI